MSGAEASSSGVIPFASAHEREQVAAKIAGVLAECSVQRLTIADPRLCRTHDVVAREANLPREIIDAPPGTTIAGDGVALLIDETRVRWVARADVAAGLLATRPG
jgi:hypothetical protein